MRRHDSGAATFFLGGALALHPVPVETGEKYWWMEEILHHLGTLIYCTS